MNTAKIFTMSNVKFVLRRPSAILAFIKGGKTEAYRVALKGLLKLLSKCDEPLIEMLVQRSTSSFQLPKEASVYKNGSDFLNVVMLYYLVRFSKPQQIVETGVWSGKTSWAMLQALADNGGGHLASIDLGVERSGGSTLPTREIGGFVPQELRRYWTLEFGDARELLPKTLKKLGTIDMFYHDSNHSYEHMMFEFTSVLSHTKEKSIICSDDINLNNAWKDFCRLLKDHHEIDNRFGYGHR